MSNAKSILLKIFGPLLLSESKVVSNERLSPHFHLLTIKGKSLRKTQWIPGQKIQIKMKDESMRSYTPSSWDSKAGVLQTLIYMHGRGPGALWARDAEPSSKVTILGPRKSLTLAPEDESLIFFGDETTFGLAYALKEFAKNIKSQFYFESVDTAESIAVLKRFKLDDSPLFTLDQLSSIAAQIIQSYNQNPKARIVLSGKQQSIVKLRELLYEGLIPQDKISTKVYWGWKDDPNGKLKK